MQVAVTKTKRKGEKVKLLSFSRYCTCNKNDDEEIGLVHFPMTVSVVQWMNQIRSQIKQIMKPYERF